ncbi:RHS repeat-associated core domain-containing protein [Acinetobacter sp. NIPH 2699]|uniref:RHS repeat-associated core domain-containing protein n=1 Tax=Acinetobacter sp. NIPH 2699 TaxID=2923433 RepID=UPI001F4B1AED|nr:RHS repeat-associated core domain-containing protein [Acinetobacter sp. NIPH 2699]MCH7335326.1 DUF6531 domain-containing protein [Acinetobacter sp. NIPH 2699]
MKKNVFAFILLNGMFSASYAASCLQNGGGNLCSVPKKPNVGEWSYYCPGGSTRIGCPQRVSTYAEAMHWLERDFAENYHTPNVKFSPIQWQLEERYAHASCPVGETRIANAYKNKILYYQLAWANVTINPQNPSPGSGCYSIIRDRPVDVWECPANTTKVDHNNDPNKPPFYCRIPVPPKGCSATVGNPCSITTGNKFQVERDWSSNLGILAWIRTYNSLDSNKINETIPMTRLGIGQVWTHNYNLSLRLYRFSELTGGQYSALSVDDEQELTLPIWGVLTRPDGAEVYIDNKYSDTTIAGEKGWFIQRDKSLKLVYQPDGLWRVEQLKTGIIEYYDKTGRFIKMTYPNGQSIELSYDDVQLNISTILIDVLVKVTDHFGRSLQFNYNPQGFISSVTLPSGKQITYQYDNFNRLVSVIRPSYGTKIYHYNESPNVAPSGNPNLLTGITDEAGKRFANYAYDVQDRGILTEQAGGVQRYELTHHSSVTYVKNPYGTQITYSKSQASGSPRVKGISQLGYSSLNNTYDPAGNITQKIEKGQTTTYSYDLSRNLETSRTEAVGTAQARTINTTWHTDFPKPVQIQEVSQGQVIRTTIYSYDNQGNALSKTITDPNTQESRIWSYEYNNFGQMTKQTTPNGEVTTYQYDESNGNLLSSTDANGIAITYSLHNTDGQPTRITTSTGQITELVYDDAGRVIQQKQTVSRDDLQQQNNEDGLSWWQQFVNAIYSLLNQEQPYTETEQKFIVIANQVSAQQAVNLYEYDPRGLLIATTLADGEHIEYIYDDAHRLTEIKDQSGNRTVYTLNPNGDITQTEVYGVTGQLEAKNRQVYDNLGRLQQTLGNHQQVQTLTYNNYDQPTNDKNTLNQSYNYTYDVLGRQITEKDPLNQSSQYEYDAFDQLKKVIDAKGGTTTYQYNAFGEVKQLNSPDTGITNYQYQNGKLLEKVDANQRKHRYQYDAQGRVTLQQDQYADGTDQYENTTFAYGQMGNDQGKLVQANNKRAETHFSYNDLGLVRQKTVKYLTAQQSMAPELNVYYSYSLGGKLKQVGLPSGNIVNYDYDNKGQLVGINLNSQNFINNIQHSANGIKGWTYSQVGDQVQFQYDLDGRIQKILMPNVYEKDYSYDTADRILAITDPTNSHISSSFKHDALSRLIEQNLANRTFKYSYDANSNRLTRNQTINGVSTTENYTIQVNNNRINTISQGTNSTTYSYLPTGQISNDGTRSYSYNAQGRSESINTGGSSSFNIYDAFGQRIQKIGSYLGNQTQTLFVYDESGQLLGEYTPQGQVVREYIWLDNRLVGLRSYQYPNEILRVHTDHLGTPRAISNNQNEILWRWEGDQFGDVLPIGDLTFPMRHAGQYYDAEVNLFYNYFRDYNPITGRYVESDPIGLQGGLNTYGYVSANPLLKIDPRGLIEWEGSYKEAGSDFLFIGAKHMYFNLSTKCVNGYKGKAKIIASGVGGSGGLTLGKVSLGGGRVMVNDGLNDVNPNVFNGSFYYGGMSFGFHGSIATVKIGGARGSMTTKYTDNLKSGYHNDFLSFESVAGVARVISSNKESCCEN